MKSPIDPRKAAISKIVEGFLELLDAQEAEEQEEVAAPPTVIVNVDTASITDAIKKARGPVPYAG